MPSRLNLKVKDRSVEVDTLFEPWHTQEKHMKKLFVYGSSRNK